MNKKNQDAIYDARELGEGKVLVLGLQQTLYLWMPQRGSILSFCHTV